MATGVQRASQLTVADLKGRVDPDWCHVRLLDRKSTRLNSSHGYISYAAFCLEKKKLTRRQFISPYPRNLSGSSSSGFSSIALILAHSLNGNATYTRSLDNLSIPSLLL